MNYLSLLVQLINTFIRNYYIIHLVQFSFNIFSTITHLILSVQPPLTTFSIFPIKKVLGLLKIRNSNIEATKMCVTDQ